jgi:ADP-ribose pyrophosphatase YjhB (NUDIX family)
MEQINRFSLRVYGIIRHEEKGILVSDEYIKGAFYTKFPGGGLEFGEGIRDCLKREMKEETGIDMEIGRHIYTTDFFQRSAFINTDQIISIYYEIESADIHLLKVSKTLFDFDEYNLDNYDQLESLRWIPWGEFNRSKLSLPIDKIVADMLVAHPPVPVR